MTYEQHITVRDVNKLVLSRVHIGPGTITIFQMTLLVLDPVLTQNLFAGYRLDYDKKTLIPI